MSTFRDKYGGMYTETKKIVNGEVDEVTCCCADPGMTRRGCAIKSGNKHPCRCYCHRRGDNEPKVVRRKGWTPFEQERET